MFLQYDVEGGAMRFVLNVSSGFERLRTICMEERETLQTFNAVNHVCRRLLINLIFPFCPSRTKTSSKTGDRLAPLWPLWRFGHKNKLNSAAVMDVNGNKAPGCRCERGR